MENTVLHLIGFPGVGKYTVAKNIAEMTDNTIVMDNQSIASPLFRAAAHDTRDGNFPSIDRLFDRYHQIAALAIEQAADAPQDGRNYVFTNVLVNDGRGENLFQRIKNLATLRNSTFLAVVLECDEQAHLKRIDSAERAALFKLADPVKALEIRNNEKVLLLPPEEALFIDSTTHEPFEIAKKIVTEAEVRSLTHTSHLLDTDYDENRL